jgi:hypothetical protein
MDYLKKFTNLHVIGRGGTFQYLNMDHAIESGMKAAEAILGKDTVGHGCTRINTDELVETMS